MHSNHMHLNFYVCYGIKYKMLFAGGGTYNKDMHLCGILSFGVDCLISSTHFGDGSAKKYHI